MPAVSWKKGLYVNESMACKTLARFHLGAAGLGNKAPWVGRPDRTKFCPLRPGGVQSNEQHIVMCCRAVEKERKETGLLTTINLGRLAGLEDEQVYYNLLNGRARDGKALSRADFLAVGKALNVVLDKWLSLW